MWNIQVIKRDRAKLLTGECKVYDSTRKNHNRNIRKFCSCIIYDATIVLFQKVDWYGLTVHTSQSETVQCPNRPKRNFQILCKNQRTVSGQSTFFLSTLKEVPVFKIWLLRSEVWSFTFSQQQYMPWVRQLWIAFCRECYRFLLIESPFYWA